jgi:hypothetical protein
VTADPNDPNNQIDPNATADSEAPEDPTAVSREVLSDLERLIEALDRRVPRLERLGEARIAREASELRVRALKLIRQIRDGAPPAAGSGTRRSS